MKGRTPLSKVLIIGPSVETLVNFRGSLLKAIRDEGHMVFATANGRDADTEMKLQAMGVEYFPTRIARTGMNPLADFLTLFDLIRLISRVKPDIILSYTIKPVIFGGLAAHFCGVGSVYSLVTGLGYAFMDAVSPHQRLAGWLARFLYRLSLRYSHRIFFQNPDDERDFVNMGLVSSDRAVVVNGSGVDLSKFHFSALIPDGLFLAKPLRFLLIARLLKDKGINEYVEAARIIRKKYPQTEFHLIGFFDPNPAKLKPEEVRTWEDQGLIKFHGRQSDVRPFLRNCHVYVLPSYREGTSLTALEAMATGRAVITTDVPGCRETVGPPVGGWPAVREANVRNLKVGRNGILVPVKNAQTLVAAMEFFLKHPEQIAIMGKASRSYAEERYDVHKVNVVMLHEMGLDERSKETVTCCQ